MELMLTADGGTRDITQMVSTLTWSGDKSTITRKLTASIAYLPATSLPVPDLGNAVTLLDEGTTLFSGYVVKRTLDSESFTMDITCYDRGVYLKNNDGTYKFKNMTAEAICRQVCADKGIPVSSLAATGVTISRKFSAVALDKIVMTAYSLASEQNGKRYAFRMTPSGLLVKEKSQSAASLNLRPKSNLVTATTSESIVNMCNSVGIYDENGSLLRVICDQDAIDLYGTMQKHITQKDGEDATSTAQAELEDGAMEQSVSVQVLGDTSLITGETVMAEEDNTGLSGLFWIDADNHTWKQGQYLTKLTLNCRSVMTKTTSGSELT